MEALQTELAGDPGVPERHISKIGGHRGERAEVDVLDECRRHMRRISPAAFSTLPNASLNSLSCGESVRPAGDSGSGVGWLRAVMCSVAQRATRLGCLAHARGEWRVSSSMRHRIESERNIPLEPNARLTAPWRRRFCDGEPAAFERKLVRVTGEEPVEDARAFGL